MTTVMLQSWKAYSVNTRIRKYVDKYTLSAFGFILEALISSFLLI